MGEGQYNFNSTSFPVDLPPTDSMVLALGGNSYINGFDADEFSPTNCWGKQFVATSKTFYGVNFEIPEAVRNIKIAESRAEKLMKKINSCNRKVIINFYLNNPKTQEEQKEQGIHRNLIFKVTKINVVIPKCNTNNSKDSEVILFSWTPSAKEKRYSGPNMSGVWRGSLVRPSNKGGDKIEFNINLEQSRTILNGISHGYTEDRRRKEWDGEVTGEIQENGDFKISIYWPPPNTNTMGLGTDVLQGHLDGNEVSGKVVGYNAEGQFKMIRADE